MKFFPSGGARATRGLCRALTFFYFVGLFFFAFTATAQTTNGLSDAEVKGQQLAQEILQGKPASNFSQTGILKTEYTRGKTAITWIMVMTSVTNESWETDYHAEQTNNNVVTDTHLNITHSNGQPNKYLFVHDVYSAEDTLINHLLPVKILDETQIMAPFADSDFWICDLGLEFFHWPGQKIIKHQERRTRECTVLESTNPNPSPGGYSHVDSWIDDETLGIVHAEAYDANGKLLKVFDPKSFKKVNGQWELQDMEIRNVQTGSRTWIKFDLNNKS